MGVGSHWRRSGLFALGSRQVLLTLKRRQSLVYLSSGMKDDEAVFSRESNPNALPSMLRCKWMLFAFLAAGVGVTLALGAKNYRHK